jgi:gliding motility-associated-like protein
VRREHGCDSLIEVELEILPQTQEFLPVYLCQGESWSLGGVVFHENHQQGQVRLPAANRYGCDSLVDVRLRFHPEAVGAVDPVICRSDTLWVQNTAFHAGHRRDTLLLAGASSLGCDSFTVVRLGIFPEKREEVRLQVCPEDTITYLGERFYRGKERGELVLRGADVNGCDSTVAVVAEVYPEAHGAVKDTLCPGERLMAGGEWFSESRSEGYLVLRDASQYGCDSALEVSLFYPQNDLQLPEEYETLYGHEIQLVPWYWDWFVMWNWTPGWGLSCTDCERPWSDGLESGSYRLVGTDQYGCEYEATTRVIVRKERRVFIPNAITVNGDGVNDRFTAFGNYFVDRIEFVEIFDRWGNFIIRIEDIPHSQEWWGWDGTHRGELVLPGVYAYRVGVRYLDGMRETFYGDVTVIR